MCVCWLAALSDESGLANSGKIKRSKENKLHHRKMRTREGKFLSCAIAAFLFVWARCLLLRPFFFLSFRCPWPPDEAASNCLNSQETNAHTSWSPQVFFFFCSQACTTKVGLRRRFRLYLNFNVLLQLSYYWFLKKNVPNNLFVLLVLRLLGCACACAFVLTDSLSLFCCVRLILLFASVVFFIFYPCL